MIIRKPYSIQRFLEIMYTMPKPQVMYEQGPSIDDPFAKHFNIYALNKNGICLYVGKYNISEITPSMEQWLKHLPYKMFQELSRFKSHGNIDIKQYIKNK